MDKEALVRALRKFEQQNESVNCPPPLGGGQLTQWVNHEVLPSIRKTGKYEARPTVPSYMLESEEERAIAWAEEHRQARLALEGC